jgi:hypothetical protein
MLVPVATVRPSALFEAYNISGRPACKGDLMVVGACFKGSSNVCTSFRGDAKHRTRNLEILRCATAHHSSMLRIAHGWLSAAQQSKNRRGGSPDSFSG